MIKFDKNEFLKPQIYSTLDEYETRCNVTEEIIKEIEQLQQENKILKENAENNDKVVDKVNWENNLLKQQNQKYKEVIDKSNKLIDKCIFPAYDEQSNDFQESLYKIKEVLKEVE